MNGRGAVHPPRHRPARQQVVLIDDAAQHEANMAGNPRAPILMFPRRVHLHEQANKHSNHEPDSGSFLGYSKAGTKRREVALGFEDCA